MLQAGATHEATWTTVAAIIGAITGPVSLVFVIYTFFSQHRLRLKVIPKLTAIRHDVLLSSDREVLPDGVACIEVINCSAFSVTIAEVGFFLIGVDGRLPIMPNPWNLLPKRLEPGESIDVIATLNAGFPKNAKRAYAKTQSRQTR